VTTALAAYRALEDRRMIESRPQKGFFVCAIQAAHSEPENPVLYAERIDEPLTHDALNSMDSLPGLVSFGTALCCGDLFPVEALARSISSTARKHSELLVEVSFSSGAKRLRESLATHASTWNCRFSADEVLITNGCVEAFGLCLQATAKPGDVVIVESPAYYGYLSTIAQLGMLALPLPLPLHSRPTDAIADIARLASKRPIGACLVSTSVSNPSGMSMTNDTKRELVEALEAMAIPLIEDATFSDLHFDSVQRAAKSYDHTGNVLLCSSLTKTLAPGLRIGWVSGGRHHQNLVALKRTMSIGQPLLIQEAMGEFLAGGGYQHHLRRLKRQCQAQVSETAKIVTQFFPPETDVGIPSGGYLLWIQLPQGISSIEVSRHAYRDGITVAPGTLFSPTGAFDDRLRLNCGYRLNEKRHEALRRLGEIAYELQ
jgi:DNA-binding transcriptional MocR family regulator